MSHNTSMPDGLLPLFPLEVVLLPHTPLPLHIFEDRYKEMIGECLARGKEFGVLRVRGHGVVRTGCTAEVLDVVRQYEDGKLDIVTLGRRRFLLKSIHSRRSFLEGEVEFVDDTDFQSAAQQAIRSATTSFHRLQQLTGSDEGAPDLDHPELSFQLAQISNDLDFRQTLLECRSEAEWMDQVAAHLALLVRRLTIGDAVKQAARSNGHGKHLPELTNPE